METGMLLLSDLHSNHSSTGALKRNFKPLHNRLHYKKLCNSGRETHSCPEEMDKFDHPVVMHLALKYGFYGSIHKREYLKKLRQNLYQLNSNT